MPGHRGPGVLVVFEGIDGAGKTTQVEMLESALRKAKEPVTRSKEPTNGSWGKKIRDSASTGRKSPREELKYFLYDREQHAQAIVRPALQRGEVVILDRYYYSTIAYQGVRGLPVEKLHQMMKKKFLRPDVVFLLDISPDVSIPRIRKRGDIPNEFERIHNLEDARDIFNSIRDTRIVKIDAAMSAKTVHKIVLEEFISGAFKKRRCFKQAYECDEPALCGYRMAGTCAWANSKLWQSKALLAK